MNIPNELTGFKSLLRIAVLPFLFCFFYSLAVIALEEYFGDHIYSISPQTGSVFGIAVAFFLGFRMNSAYDRWWEARKNIGELTYNSRNFTAKVCTYYFERNKLDENTNKYHFLIGTKIMELLNLYVAQFRLQLHNKTDVSPELVKLDASLSYLPYALNKPTYILQVISLKIQQSGEHISSMEKYDLMILLNKFYEIQGKSERTKNTPFLNIYKAFTRLIVISFVLLLPFFIGDLDVGGETSKMELLAIPLITLIGTIFITINKLSNLYGDPFNLTDTSFPLEKITKSIESEIQDSINYFSSLQKTTSNTNDHLI